jgi:hypothetical protein
MCLEDYTPRCHSNYRDLVELYLLHNTLAAMARFCRVIQREFLSLFNLQEKLDEGKLFFIESYFEAF